MTTKPETERTPTLLEWMDGVLWALQQNGFDALATQGRAYRDRLWTEMVRLARIERGNRRARMLLDKLAEINGGGPAPKKGESDAR